MAQEHPFAQYVRILGKGPRLSRPLTFEEARDAFAMVLKGEVEPVQLGAFLCLLRVKTETPEEAAGLAAAIRATITPPANAPKVDLDWSSYAGKTRQLPLYLLAALTLAGHGIRVFMHGSEGHTAGRVWTSEALSALGLAQSTSMAEACARLERGNFAYMTLEHLSPPLHAIMELRHKLGLRSPVHTVARLANPFGAACSLSSVSHPPYAPVHQEALRLLGDQRMAVFKGEGGEAERRPEKECEVLSLVGGQPLSENWPALVDGARPHEEHLNLSRLKALWTGAETDETAAAAITGTMAIALRAMGQAASVDEAEGMAQVLWRERNRAKVPGAA
ncbi:Anthranilate phosphoribosyltransferase [Paramagnetospirillum magnetotacticum MS-1]|uniref:Anthranilate phosphoribosyltransferase n=1 Tax=Paramagnetospirillum magnetotacticum MS-1 TaxID=272627 RepID=A0A0C2YHN4_PARME|nr:glycosyl transferase family protein [Paramagnetospirillum magnetotacticum]KIL99244.1 Anthranilate phosphoribosyltransferase [Paramagnetospirillum magnetotacticum MS-1]